MYKTLHAKMHNFTFIANMTIHAKSRWPIFKIIFFYILAKHRNLQIKVIIYQNQLLKNTFNMLYVWKHSKASKSVI